MVNSLRKNFVMVTMTLMLFTFGSFLLVSYFYNSYWNNYETSGMLDLIAESGYFFSYQDTEIEESIKDFAEGGSPVLGLLVDESGNVISSKVVGGKGKLVVPDNIIKKILKANDREFQIDSYVYSKLEVDDSQTLIVIIDNFIDENYLEKLSITVFLVLIGIIILTVITFYLSNFVTKPAKDALLREKRFISDACHELKTPLGAISINAQALSNLQQDNLYVNNIKQESERMSRLIERLLTLSRLEEGEPSVKNKISLSELTMEMALTYDSISFEKGYDYKYDIEDDIYINGNDDEIRQLLAILIDNAIKNTNQGGSITLKCAAQDKKALIEVVNSGEGISSEDLPHVFERFYTSDTSRSKKSFGLGLAIAKTIVEGHKGEISVSSIPNEKTTFTVIFKAE